MQSTCNVYLSRVKKNAQEYDFPFVVVVVPRSLLELANSDVDPNKLNQLMSSMTAQAGLGAKDKLRFEDFTKILNDENDLLNYARLGWKGQSPSVLFSWNL